MRINNQKHKGLAEAMGLALLLKGVPGSFFDMAVKSGLSCSYQHVIDMLSARASDIIKVCEQFDFYSSTCV